jgi:hypothetical protein
MLLGIALSSKIPGIEGGGTLSRPVAATSRLFPRGAVILSRPLGALGPKPFLGMAKSPASLFFSLHSSHVDCNLCDPLIALGEWEEELVSQLIVGLLWGFPRSRPRRKCNSMHFKSLCKKDVITCECCRSMVLNIIAWVSCIERISGAHY